MSIIVPTNGIYPYIKDPSSIPERFVQNGGDKIPFSYDLDFHFGANHNSPYYNKEYNGESKVTALTMSPTQQPIKRQTMFTTTETYSNDNMNPRTLLNYAQPSTFGVGRNQVSLISDPVRHRAGRELPVNNKAMFENVARTERMVRVPQRPL